MQFKALVLFGLVAVASAGRIDPGLLTKLQAGKQDVIIELGSKLNAVLSAPQMASLTGEPKVDMMITLLKEQTEAAQVEIIQAINARGVAAKQLWISNKISVKSADLEFIQHIAEIEGDFLIREAVTVSINPAFGKSYAAFPLQDDAQWGVAKINAPAAWETSRGENVIVGIIDTGVNGRHAALKDSFSGEWSDPIYGDSSPTDGHGHGSHAIGSAVGRANGIGVAPGATWAACKGLDNQGSGSEDGLIECAQNLLNGNPRPHIVSNSWGGSGGQTFYNDEISAWRAAGIVPVFAISNDGSSCRSAGSPGDQPNLISVGATDTNDALAYFSSRGPSSPGNRMKPEVSAPGVNIISAGTGTNNYATMSGTSMATPHVAGAIAVYLSAHPNANFQDVQNALQSTAIHPPLTNADRNCGTAPGADFPNNAFGHGRIDIYAALRA